MGFSNVVTTAAATIPQLFTASAQRQESRNLNRVATLQEQQARQQSDSMVNVAMRNQMHAARNANDQLAAARADAAGSNLAEDGSTLVRERDLATRLQDEINANTNSALQQANATFQQGMLNAWNTRNEAALAKARSKGSYLSAFGSLIGGIASGLGTGNAASRAKA